MLVHLQHLCKSTLLLECLMQVTKLVIQFYHLRIQKLLFKVDQLLLKTRSKVSLMHGAHSKGQHRGYLICRAVLIVTQCCHVFPYHEHCRLILNHPYLSVQNLQLRQLNTKTAVSLLNSFVTKIQHYCQHQ